MDDSETYVVVSIEPSKRLSELCGFPYFIERRFPLGELLDKGIVDEDDIDKMRGGQQIHKRIKVDNGH